MVNRTVSAAGRSAPTRPGWPGRPARRRRRQRGRPAVVGPRGVGAPDIVASFSSRSADGGCAGRSRHRAADDAPPDHDFHDRPHAAPIACAVGTQPRTGKPAAPARARHAVIALTLGGPQANVQQRDAASGCGRTPPREGPTREALVVVDVRRSTTTPAGAAQQPSLRGQHRRAAGRLAEAGEPIVFVRRLPVGRVAPEPRTARQRPAAWRPMLVTKSVNSAFHGSPDLHAWLVAQGIERIVVCGITTNHCCETTARVGGPRVGRHVRHRRHLHVRPHRTGRRDDRRRHPQPRHGGQSAR